MNQCKPYLRFLSLLLLFWFTSAQSNAQQQIPSKQYLDSVYSIAYNYYEEYQRDSSIFILQHLKDTLWQVEVHYAQEKLADVYHLLALLYFGIEQYAASLNNHEEALALSDIIKDSKLHCNSLIGIGTNYRQIGKYRLAHKRFDQAVDKGLELKDYNVLFWSWYHKGYSYYLEKKYDLAEVMYRRCIQIDSANGMVNGSKYMVYNVLGDLYREIKPDQAIAQYDTAILLNTVNDQEQLCHSLMGKGEAYSRMHRNKLALSYYRKCLSIARKSELNKHVIQAYHGILSIPSQTIGAEIIKYQQSLIEEYRKQYGKDDEVVSVIESWRHIRDKKSQVALLAQQKEIAKLNMEKRSRMAWLFLGLTFVFGVLVVVYRNGYIKRVRLTEKLDNIKTELEITNDKLKFSNEKLDKFASNIAHDLRNPLSTIQLYAELMLKNRELPLGKKETYLQSIIEGTNNLFQMIKHLLSFSKITNKVDTEAVRLNELISLIVSMNQQVVSANNAEITIEELPIIRVNKSLVMQLFQNLLLNAIKYRSLDRSPEIIVYHDLKKSNDKNHACIVVEDNGQGIERENFDYIFEPFASIDERDNDSHGIGLALCKRIVDGYGGDIWLESEVGVGTKFFLTLPLNSE